ncbi:MAG: DUF4178 domain-containing protein [Bacteroidetes bacterium]|nr:MAG: DUF4178 domain-containing protein [Bacteroidota bacterium]
MVEIAVQSHIIPLPNQLTCTHCNSKVTNVLHRTALAYACMHCKSYYVGEKGLGYKFVHSFNEVFTPDLPLNTKGVLFGVTYEIVGFAVRSQLGAGYAWREYTLFNLYEGFATLTEFNGHWIFARPMQNYPNLSPSGFSDILQYEGKSYQKYNKYKSTVKYAAGEFGYDIFSDKKKVFVEWISPPYMLIREKDDDELIWCKGVGINANEVKDAFKISSLPEREGIGALQLMPVSANVSFLLTSTFVFILILLVGQYVIKSPAEEKKIFDHSYSKTNVDSSGVIVTNNFEVTGGKTALQFNVYAPLTNDWFDLNFELINEATGERFEGAKSLEFYSGTDSEGAWSEGTRQDYIIISSVPPGRYHLNLYPTWNSNSSVYVSFGIEIIQGVSLWANFTLFFLLGIIIPVIQVFRMYAFEQKRWLGSDFSPKLTIWNL